MSAEFSLLQHLGVSVGKCEPAPAAQSSSAPKAPPKDAFRVWAPAQHPPPSKKVSPDRVRGVLARRRKGPAKSYADPTGEVFLRNDHGEEVQYVVYNSKVPSIYGVNRQLAERKRAEKAHDNNVDALTSCDAEFGQDEALQEKARRNILRELQICNQEQANRKKEEERRDRERRIAQEKAQLRYRDAEAARSDEEARIHKTQQQEALRMAAAEAATARKQAATTPESDYAVSTWNGADEDEERRCATQRRTREFSEANRQMAEQQRAERDAREAAERENARVARAEAEQQMREEQMREAATRQQTAEALRQAQEAERERRLTASAAGSRPPPALVGSLFDFAEKRESEEAQRAQQRLREDMAINARLAEAKRARTREEREQERSYAAQVADANFEDFQREVAQSRLRRLQEQKEMQNAAEVAAAAAREKQKQEALVDRSRPDDALLFWAGEDSSRAEETKAEAERRYREEVRRQAERKRAERARDDEEKKAWERALVASDSEAAKAADARERRETQEKIAQLRHTLEDQMAAKKEQRRQEHPQSSQRGLLRGPAPDAISLYRCPVTGELLPASAYDFGIRRGR